MPKTLLLTGASGFLGRILLTELRNNFHVSTLDRSNRADIRTDLSTCIPILPKRYNWVVHNAGKAHSIPRTLQEAKAFEHVNVWGTQHLLDALDTAGEPPDLLVYISSAAVYGLVEGERIDESAPLLGNTPYALSKINAERIIMSWTQQRGVNAIILRPPLIVAPEAPGNLKAMRNAIRRGFYIRILGNKARKSAVLAVDIAKLISTLDGKAGIYNITDGVHPLFSDFEDALSKAVGKKINWALHIESLRKTASIGDKLLRFGLPFPLNTERLWKMTSTLTFSDEMARQALGWNPAPVLSNII